MKKILVAFCLILLATVPAMAGSNVRALNVFPYTFETESVPLYPENIEQLCKTTPNDDGMCVENEPTVTGEYSDPEDTITLTGKVTAYRRGQSDNWEIPHDGQPPQKCMDYECPQGFGGCQKVWVNKCTTKVFAEGFARVNVPAVCPTTTLNGVAYELNSSSIDCPDVDDVPTQDVTYKQLVTSACPGDTIQVEASGYAWKTRTVRYRIVVRYFKPGKTTWTEVYRGDRTKEVGANGFFYDSIEGGFKVEKAGTYTFKFNVMKFDGTPYNRAKTRTVVVPELCEPKVSE
jgi:hypothetical protein